MQLFTAFIVFLTLSNVVKGYITEVKLVTCELEYTCPGYPGYRRIEIDLNEDTGRSPVYLHIKEDPTENPITDIQILMTSTPPSLPHWTRLDVDLNQNDAGSNENPIWLYYTKDVSVSANPITSIVVKKGEHPVVAAEYKRVPINLNHGIGGTPLYLFYSQDGPKDPITALTAKACFTKLCYMEGWERVEGDCNKDVVVGMHVYLFYKREKSQPPVTDVVLVLDDQTEPEGYLKVDLDLNYITFRGASIHLWYKIQSSPTEEDIHSAVQDMAIEYGPNATIPFGWERLDTDLNSNSNGDGGFGEPTFLFIRRGYAQLPRRTPLIFREDGTFKILQLADLHFTNEEGECKDMLINTECKGDATTLAAIEQLMDKENPDLVVFSGDNIDETVTDARAATFKFTQPIVQRKVPWVALFGNHDDKGDLTREELFEVMERIPYNRNKKSPLHVPGIINFAIKIHSNTTFMDHTFTLYFLDTRSKDDGTKTNYIQKEQLDWSQTTSAEFLGINKTQKPNAIAFFHAPIWEYHGVEDHSLPHLGDQREVVSSPKKNKTFSVLDTIIKAGDIKATSCGSDHVNDYCLQQQGIQLCYSGGMGVGGYGAAHIGWPRRARVWELGSFGQRIVTWKRLQDTLALHNYQTVL
ncbi:Metallo-dependent phosphatase-like protein [Spinellus fusiger]|nr:Metallo-dependent phosphatase-like protein [Spinellus fusiger]